MKNTLIYLFIIIASFACNKKDDRLKDFKQTQKYQEAKRTIRTKQDVEKIVNSVDPTTKSSGVKIRPLLASDILIDSIASNPNDTLLYIADGGDKSMVISPNVKCNPVIAIFDSPDNPILEEIANPSQSNSGLLEFIEQAIIYNQRPNDFEVYQNTKSPLSITDEVKPKVPVTWDQKFPFNKYIPNKCVAGCVSVALTQALMVTRHMDTFNDIPLDYDGLIKMKNRTYDKDFPNEANTIARLIYEIGRSIETNYGKSGSTADPYVAIRWFIKIGNKLRVDIKPSSIRKILKNYSNGIVIVDSRSQKAILGKLQGIGHTYLADGYRIYSDGSDLIHINFGCEKKHNGYFLTKLTAPNFTSDSPEKLPYDWDFFCIYK